ncbi:MAG: flavodoxin family protein, partial [Oscillospiraceae bacterium]|nr:flavodoxin family protein [Oscillospiraceae bacterium]
MEIKTVHAVYFSATGKTRRIASTLANAIALALEVPLEIVDFTAPAAREESYSFCGTDLVIFASPTYAGKLPNKILPFVQTGFAGNGALAVPVVTFGNRSFDNSLAELAVSLENAGFHTVAAGAFACQHSFSKTLAVGRPDADDLRKLGELGAAIVGKLGRMNEVCAPVAVPGDADAPYYVPKGLDGEPKKF